MTHSANPEELEGLGTTLKAQIGIVNKIISDVDGPLGSIVWTGPAKEAFRSEWDGNFKTALGKLNEAFEVAGQDCTTRAQGVRIALGTGGGGA